MSSASHDSANWLTAFENGGLALLTPAERAELDALTVTPAATLEAIRADPAAVMSLTGATPDPWQAAAMRSRASRLAFLTTRQAGKSTTAAAIAVQTILVDDNALVLVLSPSDRQSKELLLKVLDLYDRLGRPVATTKATEHEVRLTNGGRIVALPDNEKTVRSFSGVRLLLIDEAARVSDELYRSVRPMLSVSRGRLLLLSTAFGKRGFFFDAWESADAWERTRITARQCPRITPEFLAEERQAMGERFFNQEYMCGFEDAVGAVFSQADIQAALATDLKPLFE